MDTVEYILPAYWASALINGDLSGLSDEDEKQLEAFTSWMVNTHGSCIAVDCSEDEGNFMRYHDGTPHGVLACNVLTYTFHTGE